MDTRTPTIDNPTPTPTHSLSFILKSLLAGGLAGSAAKTAVAPLDRVKILFQTSHSSYISFTHTGSLRGFISALNSLYSHDGFPGLFRGHTATLLRIFPYAGIKFMAYEQAKSLVPQGKPWKFVAGAGAGCVAVILTYPFDVVRVRLAYETEAVRATIWGITRTMYAEDGLRTFYRGLGPSVLGMVPYAGVSFYTYELFTDWAAAWTADPGVGRRGISDTALIVCGGASGVLAQTVSYPFEVVRRHMQVSSVAANTNTTTTTTTTTADDKKRWNMWRTGSSILEKRGVKGLFVGLGIGYLKIVPMFAVSFYTYERAKEMLNI